MADGYARVKRKAGVCFATSGPGATNLITGIATAYADSSPMVAVTGQVPLEMIGKDAFQETDIVGIANPCTKYTFQPRRAVEIPETVKKGFYIAESGRPGPVLIDIPKDVQQDSQDIEFPDLIKVRGYRVIVRSRTPYNNVWWWRNPSRSIFGVESPCRIVVGASRYNIQGKGVISGKPSVGNGTDRDAWSCGS
jgi:thiamine pyrophosphate-dependent acetolactate synthase large subunit-like protein